MTPTNNNNSSFLNAVINFSILISEIYMVVSLANILVQEFGKKYVRSLIKIKNKSGPKTEPCGTPNDI